MFYDQDEELEVSVNETKIESEHSLSIAVQNFIRSGFFYPVSYVLIHELPTNSAILLCDLINQDFRNDEKSEGENTKNERFRSSIKECTGLGDVALRTALKYLKKSRIVYREGDTVYTIDYSNVGRLILDFFKKLPTENPVINNHIKVLSNLIDRNENCKDTVKEIIRLTGYPLNRFLLKSLSTNESLVLSYIDNKHRRLRNKNSEKGIVEYIRIPREELSNATGHGLNTIDSCINKFKDMNLIYSIFRGGRGFGEEKINQMKINYPEYAKLLFKCHTKKLLELDKKWNPTQKTINLFDTVKKRRDDIYSMILEWRNLKPKRVEFETKEGGIENQTPYNSYNNINIVSKDTISGFSEKSANDAFQFKIKRTIFTNPRKKTLPILEQSNVPIQSITDKIIKVTSFNGSDPSFQDKNIPDIKHGTIKTIISNKLPPKHNKKVPLPNSMITAWNNIEDTRKHNDPSTKTYKRAVKLIKDLQQGRAVKWVFEKNLADLYNISEDKFKSILSKKWAEDEILENITKNISSAFKEGNFPEDKTWLRKASFSDILHNPRTGKSFFIQCYIKPPQKIYKVAAAEKLEKDPCPSITDDFCDYFERDDDSFKIRVISYLKDMREFIKYVYKTDENLNSLSDEIKNNEVNNKEDGNYNYRKRVSLYDLAQEDLIEGTIDYGSHEDEEDDDPYVIVPNWCIRFPYKKIYSSVGKYILGIMRSEDNNIYFSDLNIKSDFTRHVVKNMASIDYSVKVNSKLLDRFLKAN